MAQSSSSSDGPADGQNSQTLLWVGNIDVKMTEFKLLKLVEKFGKLQKFDYLLHQRGPDAGKPRGYAFIAYEKAEEAKLALLGLNGFKFGDRFLAVHYANDRDDNEKFSRKLEPVASSVSHVGGVSGGKVTKNSQHKPDKRSQIAAIEAKLRAMERSSEPAVVTVPPLVLHHTRRPVSSNLRGGCSSSRPFRRPFRR